MEGPVDTVRVPQRTSSGQQLRKRAACDECRAKKLKCTGEQPTCSRCAREKITCVYSTQKRMGRPKKRQRMDSDHDDSIYVGGDMGMNVNPGQLWDSSKVEGNDFELGQFRVCLHTWWESSTVATGRERGLGLPHGQRFRFGGLPNSWRALSAISHTRQLHGQPTNPQSPTRTAKHQQTAQPSAQADIHATTPRPHFKHDRNNKR